MTSCFRKISNFSELQKRHNSFGKLIGINLSPNVGHCWTYELVFALFQFFVYSYSLLDFIFLISEHKEGRGSFFSNCRAIIVLMATICTGLPGILLHVHQKELFNLMNWCETVHNHKYVNDQKLFKLFSRFRKLAIIVPICHLSSAILTSVIQRKRQFPLTLYHSKESLQDTRVFISIFICLTMHNYTFQQYTFFGLSTFSIIVKSFSKQYHTLSESIKNLATVKSDTGVGKDLDSIGKLHSTLMENIKVFSSIYRIPLILNEYLCIVCVIIPFLIVFYEPDEHVFIGSAIVVVTVSLIYPIFGEELSNNALNFVMATNECDWISLSNENRKKLAFILLMAQKPVGVSSGGFHYSNYIEIAQVIKLVYK